MKLYIFPASLEWFHTNYFRSVALLILLGPLVNCKINQSFNSSQFSTHNDLSSTISKLRVCSGEGASSVALTRETIKIPTFSTQHKTYVLKEYRIERDNISNFCPNEENPAQHDTPLVTKDYFDAKHASSNYSTSFVFKLLRLTPLLFDIGYLSVGNDTTETATYYSTDEFCISAVRGEGVLATIDFKTCPFSKSRPVLRKCCPLGMVLESSCVGNADKWDPGYLDSTTWKMLPLDKVNPVYTCPRVDISTWEFWETDNCTLEFHPVTDNTIAFVGAYRNWEFFSANLKWCIESMILEDGSRKMVLFHLAESQNKTEDTVQKQAKISFLYMINMYVGAMFHFLTTTVYLITWTKQNIHGKTLCSCTASLFFMQVFLGTAHLLGSIGNQRNTKLCIGNGIGGQYFMIAAFTWLLVVNYDLWRTFRSMRAEGGKSLKRFLIYSAFGWFFPFLVSIISISLDYAFPCRVSRVPVPEFGDSICFIAPWAQGIYLYYILGVLIALSCIFAVLTLIGLWKLKKESVNLRSTKRADDQQNVMLFLKLSVVMGITWIFEVISWLATKENENSIGWIILDFYNALSAILIFVIFVLKKTTLNMLEQTVPMLKGLSAAVSKLTSPFSGESSDSTATTSTSASRGSNEPAQKNATNTTAVVQYKKETEEDCENTKKAVE